MLQYYFKKIKSFMYNTCENVFIYIYLQTIYSTVYVYNLIQPCACVDELVHFAYELDPFFEQFLYLAQLIVHPIAHHEISW